MFIDYPYEIEMIADEEGGVVQTLVAFYDERLVEPLLNICATRYPDKWIGAYHYPPNGGRECVGERGVEADVVVEVR